MLPVATRAVAMDGGQRAPSAVLVVPAEVPSSRGRGEREVVACGRGDAARWQGRLQKFGGPVRNEKRALKFKEPI